MIQKYVAVKAVPEFTLVDVIRFTTEEVKQFTIKLTPKDELGNYLGPGHVGAIKLESSQGELIESLEDKLDGSYQQMLQLSLEVNEEEVEIKFAVKGIASIFKLGDKLEKPKTLFNWKFTILLAAIIIILVILIRKRKEGES